MSQHSVFRELSDGEYRSKIRIADEAYQDLPKPFGKDVQVRPTGSFFCSEVSGMCKRSMINPALKSEEEVDWRQQTSSLLQDDAGGGLGGCVGVADGLGFVGLLSASGFGAAATSARRAKRRINGYAIRNCILAS